MTEVFTGSRRKKKFSTVHTLFFMHTYNDILKLDLGLSNSIGLCNRCITVSLRRLLLITSTLVQSQWFSFSKSVVFVLFLRFPPSFLQQGKRLRFQALDRGCFPLLEVYADDNNGRKNQQNGGRKSRFRGSRLREVVYIVKCIRANKSGLK